MTANRELKSCANRQLLPGEDLSRIFTLVERRTLSKNLTLSYHARTYQIETKRPAYTMRGAHIEVREASTGTLSVEYQGKPLVVSLYNEQAREPAHITPTISAELRPIRKAVIPAAGFGTRFLPIAKAVPKEMLPIVDKPVIQYVVEEAVESGITEIIIIISRSKRAIEEHFAANPELDRELESKGKHEALAELRNVDELGRKARIQFVLQPKMGGLGDAVRCAREHVGDEPFAVLLGDALVSPDDICRARLV